VALTKKTALIQKLEERRGSRIISYIAGDRQPGLETQIGMDVFPFFYDILVRMGKREHIDLVLYSTGGATMAAWGLVNLLREFCDKLCVLIPFKAQSCATLLALGANEIVMTRTGQLSPVDPTVTSPFNPILPNQPPGAPPTFLPVSVEDVIGFMKLIREEAGISTEENLTKVVQILAEKVNPLALGSVHRAKEQIRMLARKLLSFHMGPEEQAKIDSIVAALTRELFSHDYVIGRREAKEVLGLKVSDCEEALEKLIMELFQSYSSDMQLSTGYNPEVELGNQKEKTVLFDRAVIESADRAFVFRTKRKLERQRITREQIPIDVTQERVVEEGWSTLEGHG
jgi:hypothetical protein